MYNLQIHQEVFRDDDEPPLLKNNLLPRRHCHFHRAFVRPGKNGPSVIISYLSEKEKEIRDRLRQYCDNTATILRQYCDTDGRRIRVELKRIFLQTCNMLRQYLEGRYSIIHGMVVLE
jgi:hypothetical protein